MRHARSKCGCQSQTSEITVIDQRYIGQDFDAFLAEDGIAAEVEALAIKKVLAALLEQSQLSQVALAAKVRSECLPN